MPPRGRTTNLPEQVLAKQVEPESDDGCWIKDPPVKIFLPTGCTLLNLALSDRVDGGWPGGRISNPVGDTDTGKSLLMLSSLAEACRIPEFDEYELIYADVEAALSLNGLDRMFGKKFMERVNILSPMDEDNQPPETVEEWHYQIMDLLKSGSPFVYILDSLDHIPSEGELKKTEEHYQASKKKDDKKKPAGSYEMSKQKYLKKMFRELSCELMKTDSFIIIVSQTIANVGSMFNPKARAGGSGLDFSSRIIFWLSVLESDKVKNRIIGRKVRAKVSKNHITHKRRECPLWVYDHFGIDDTKSNIEFLVEEKVFNKLGAYINPEGLYDEEKFYKKDLIKVIEENGDEKKLASLVQEAWLDIERELMLDRKRRYE